MNYDLKASSLKGIYLWKKIKMKKLSFSGNGETAFNKLIKSEGFSILEVISAIFIFSVVTITIYGSFSAGLKSLAQSKHRVAATELANEKMEVIRNMEYGDIGTEGGVPNGILVGNETVWKSNQKFDVHTYIRYFDDPEDGEGNEDENMVITDRKEAKVEVTWSGVNAGHGVKLVSFFVPDGAESDVGGGTLRLNVLDGSGRGVSGVSTQINNGSVIPAVDIDTFTNSYGTILMSGMPAGDRNYEVTVSKDGYESISTSPPYPTTAYDPTDVHASVVEGNLNTKAIIIDKLSSIHVYARDILDYDHLFPNIDFNLRGGRIIGLEFGTTTEVTNYDQILATGAGGDMSVGDLSPGKYYITLNELGYTLVGTDPILPIALSPDQSLTMDLILAENATNSLIVSIKDSVTGLAVPNTSVRLFDGLGFDVTQITGQTGQIYFPPNTDPPTVLNAGDYTLEINEENHQSYSENVTVSQLTQEEVLLIPIE